MWSKLLLWSYAFKKLVLSRPHNKSQWKHIQNRHTYTNPIHNTLYCVGKYYKSYYIFTSSNFLFSFHFQVGTECFQRFNDDWNLCKVLIYFSYLLYYKNTTALKGRKYLIFFSQNVYRNYLLYDKYKIHIFMNLMEPRNELDVFIQKLLALNWRKALVGNCTIYFETLTYTPVNSFMYPQL